MSSFGNSDIGASGVGSIPNVGNNSYDFSTGLGSPDPNSGLNSLSGPLMGPNAGTVPNGFATAGGASSNFLPTGNSGISDGSMNGNLSFSMPSDSMGQLNSQKLAAGLSAGGKLANSPSSGQAIPRAGAGTVRLPKENFSSPMVDFAGSNQGSQAGQSLLQLLAKYHPGGAA